VIVTAVERRRGRRLVDVYVDGALALTLGARLAAERGLRPGRSVTRPEIAALEGEETRRSALEAALRLLSYRPRSEQELRIRLLRRGFGWPVARETLARVRELGYLDDEAFARAYTETRQAARPRSRRLAAAELRQRGVAQETADEATADISDEEAAYEAAGRRLRGLRGLEYAPFRERLGRFLTSRGFSYEVSRRTIERCWAELVGGEDPSES
jgi:regulatory protein